ncbi:UPF0103/Mediator of ErbB2-driven cell motility-containing protein [Solidesulfovibrio carbinoliphilus subsp. oakridgensis]|uniref:UPF0103/Mediator of ErbB2-driven cell motility-containing protein n=1 Tax=Solidesulfovibrio carbinoliphilus subsp. oakridgensis TaxID=694327 RepID=G7Q847_9BACT|nr:AmmeMemoRadiSam system protein B [Solidesulfovibrio carbinoliphilus]EHJ48061.1 UPF0103/Mediator of ErbB2-driven cell motility-containing protein [Solidesulfovibrio carbinoliphilus subsp. oakridgensis]
MEYPRARHDLEFIPFDHEGRNMVLVRDRLELVPYGTGIPAGLLPVLALMDGRHSLADLEKEITALQEGRRVSRDDILSVLSELDAAGLLDTPCYQSRKAEAAADFAARPVRPAVFAGQAYPDAPALLVPYLDAMLEAASARPAAGPVVAVIAPHIDPEAGKAGYGAAYGALRAALDGRTPPKRVVVLGVGHQVIKGLYCLTDKVFATPLGEVPADGPAVAALRRAGQATVDPADLPHRSEHSVEFQAVFLRHVLGDAPFTLVPILCGSPLGALPRHSRQAFREAAGPFLSALREMAADPDTLVVAGVDLFHIGPKFGHAEPAEALEEAALAHDTALLDALARGDADAIWEESARVKDVYNVCGFTALATLAEILPPATMALLAHDVMREAETRSAVSFAGAVFSPR